MKSLLGISVLTNCGLLGLVIFLLLSNHRGADSVTAPDLHAQANPVSVLETDMSPSVVKPEPFCWSQLEAADYRVYICNLRSVGCPEQTLRDIISADLDASVYLPRREKLLAGQATSTGVADDGISRQNLKSALEQLNYEEATVLNTLLGWPANPNQAANSCPQDDVGMPPAAMPLVFREADLEALELENQTNVFVALRQAFLKEIGRVNQNSDGPIDRELWRRAEFHANQRLKGMVGIRAYHAFDRATRIATHAQANMLAN